MCSSDLRLLGLAHAVDSSEQAFRTAALMGFREAYMGAKPTILEPIMKVEVEAPVEFQGSVVGQVNQRRGVIQETVSDENVTVIAEVPLAEPWVGRHLTELEEQTGARVAYVTRLGEGTLPRPDMVVQQGDLVHLAVPRDDLARVERLCDQAPAPH